MRGESQLARKYRYILKEIPVNFVYAKICRKKRTFPIYLLIFDYDSVDLTLKSNRKIKKFH